MRLLIVSLAALTMLVAVACGDDDDTGDEEPTAAAPDSTADADASPGDGASDQGPLPVATFDVDSTADAVDENPGDGVCDDGSGRCTLRAAIMEANELEGRVAITLPAGIYALSIAGRGENAAATGDLDIADDLTIIGDGADTTIVDGGGLDGVFDIGPGRTVNISALTVQNGNADLGGGIVNTGGTLTLAGVTVSGNTAEVGGGGISNTDRGTLTLTESTVAGNSVSEGLGGGIVNSGKLDISDSEIRGNEAKFGGGINNDDGGTLTLIRSTVTGNSAAALGGGINNDGMLDISDSTVSDNEAEFGGGIINQEGGALTLTGSTVTGNSAASSGGGVVNNGGELDFIDSEITDNEARDAGGGVYNQRGTVTLRGSTVRGNSAPQFADILNVDGSVRVIDAPPTSTDGGVQTRPDTSGSRVGIVVRRDELQPGDCYDFLTPSAGGRTPLVDCADASMHVLKTGSLPDTPYPGAASITNSAAAFCPSSTEFSVLPSASRWDDGDRTIICLEILDD